MELTQSYSRYKEVSEALENSYKLQDSNEFWKSSILWKGIFAHRDTTGGYSDLAVSLNERYSFSSGIAGKLDRAQKEIFLQYYEDFLPKELLKRVPQSSIGAPSVLDCDGLPTSVPYLSNLQLFSELETLLGTFAPGSKPLHVLEIGAGYGGLAYFLIRSGIAASYTVIDLPGNIEISAFHLTQNFPELKYRILSSQQSLKSPEAGTLCFVTAGNIRALDDCRFDLAINTDSLGEMPKQTAQSYVQWVRQHLVDGGLFFSKNGHRRSPDAIQNPSHLGYQDFQLLALKPPSVISSLFDDFSHYVLLRKQEATTGWDPVLFDTLCHLYACGLQGEMLPFSQAFASGKLTLAQTSFLKQMGGFFSQRSLRAKLETLDRASALEPSVVIFLKALTHYALGHQKQAAANAKAYLTSAQSYVAEAYCLMILSRKEPSVLAGPFKFGAKTRFAVDELLRFCSRGPLYRKLAYRLRREALRKKISNADAYSPSWLLKLKNLCFNLKEGKGMSVVR